MESATASVAFSLFARDLPRKAAVTRLDSSQVVGDKFDLLTYHTADSTGSCLLQLAYCSGPTAGLVRASSTSTSVLVKGQPTTLHLADWLDSGLCRVNRNDFSVEIPSGLPGLTVWLEIPIPESCQRLPRTRVTLAVSRFYWDCDLTAEEGDLWYQNYFRICHPSRYREFLLGSLGPLSKKFVVELTRYNYTRF